LYPCRGQECAFWPNGSQLENPESPSGTDVKRDIHLVVLLLLVIGCSLASLTLWKVMASRERALEEVNVHGLNLTQALSTYSEGIVRQSSLLLLGLVERLETEGSGPAQIERLRTLVSRQQPLMPQLSGVTIYDNQGRWLMSSNQPIRQVPTAVTGLTSSITATTFPPSLSSACRFAAAQPGVGDHHQPPFQ
jgi:hypothetical protein